MHVPIRFHVVFRGPSRLGLSHASCRSLAQSIVQQQQRGRALLASLSLRYYGADTRYDVIGDSFFTAKVTENAPAEGGRSSDTFRGY